MRDLYPTGDAKFWFGGALCDPCSNQQPAQGILQDFQIPTKTRTPFMASWIPLPQKLAYGASENYHLALNIPMS